jgi:hypothetical protein
MGSPMPFHDFKRKFEAFGVRVEKRPRTSHIRMRKVIGGETFIYVAVVHKNKVADVYVKKARKRFQLTPRFGVTDREFNAK